MEDSKLDNDESKAVKNLNYEFSLLISQREKATEEEQEFYDRAIDFFINKVRILNKNVALILSSELLNKLEGLRKPKIKTEKKKIPEMKLKQGERISTEYGNVKISKSERKEFMHDLQIAEDELKKLRKILGLMKKGKAKKTEEDMFKKPDPFVKMSAKIFSSLSFKLAKTGFQDLRGNLRKAAMPFLLSSYISLALFSVLLAFFAGIAGAVVFTIISQPENLAIDLIRNIAISFALPVITFFAFYAYPSTQISSFKSKIENELPFATMHMSTIAGSGVEPTRVFKIIALSDDYPAISKEAKKLMNQINFYGFDFVGALRETARTSSSPRLADLFNGMATILSTGGNLQLYLAKSAENSLLDYKLRRKSYVEATGTYADIYTGLLITAPLLFMMLLALINVIGMGMDMMTMGVIGIGAIILLNIGFLFFLDLSQPEG